MEIINKNIINLICLIFSFGFFQSQIENPGKISKKVFILSTKNTDMDRAVIIGKKMLSVSENDYDRTISNLKIGDALYKKQNFSQSVQYLEKADYYAEKNKFLNERFLANILLSLCYIKSGLVIESDVYMKTADKIAEDTGNIEFKIQITDIKSIRLEEENKFCQAIHPNLEGLHLREKHNQDQDDQAFIANRIVKLVYEYIKCGDIAAAKKMISKAEVIFKKNSSGSKVHLLEEYYLCKGMISAKEKRMKDALIYFDKAQVLVNTMKDERIKSRILEERLLNNIDADFNIRQSIYKQYISLNELRKSESKKLITKVIKRELFKLDAEKQNMALLFNITLFLASIIGGGTLIFYLYKNKPRAEPNLKIENIMDNIINDNQNTEEEKEKSDSSEKITRNEKIIIKSQKTEKRLINKLDRFESEHLYTTNGITLSRMSTMFNTNITYLAYILKKYRDLDFNSYINKKRIDYIILKIENEPKYSTYKISYLAEEAGFSTHSQFSNVFKLETGISPSDFIEQVKKKQNGTE